MGAAFCGSQRCMGNPPVRNSRSNVHTPMLSFGDNCPFIMEKNSRSIEYWVAGSRDFIADDVSKMNRKRLSAPPAAGWADALSDQRIPAQSTVRTRTRETKG